MERTVGGFFVSGAPAAVHDSSVDYERDKGQEADLPEGGIGELQTDADALSIDRMEGMDREGSSEEPYMPVAIGDDEDVWELRCCWLNRPEEGKHSIL